jgi:uroporphyrinogen-III decarboxylase
MDNKLTVRDRVMAVLEGEKPDRLPFIDRLELWYTSRSRVGTLPEELVGMSLNEVHQAVGIGQQKFLFPYSLKLRGVEVISSFEGETVYREIDPVVDTFPTMSELVKQDEVGVTAVELITPIGTLTLRHEVLGHMVVTGSHPYLTEHPLKGESDCRTLEYILERAEYVPQYERLHREQTEIGDTGFVVPLVARIPFQQVLIDYLGEVPLFYALYDDPSFVQRLMGLLDQQLVDILNRLADLPVPYIEFPDNLHGPMTNPRLFSEYCLPYYQRYADILHGQDKKAGSHTDGDVKSLLGLLTESGLDVCESFSPAPLTECTFEEAWHAWCARPIIWGGIPSPILEERTSETEFRNHVELLLQTIGDRPIILGVGDMVMGNNLIERVRYIAGRIEEHTIDV